MRLKTAAGRSLATPSTVEGAKVLSPRGDKVGTIHTIMFDEVSGAIAYLVLKPAGGLFGGRGDKLHPAPWSCFTFDPERFEYVADFDADALKASPAYDADQLASSAYAWGEQVQRHFTAAAGGTA